MCPMGILIDFEYVEEQKHSFETKQLSRFANVYVWAHRYLLQKGNNNNKSDSHSFRSHSHSSCASLLVLARTKYKSNNKQTSEQAIVWECERENTFLPPLTCIWRNN